MNAAALTPRERFALVLLGLAAWLLYACTIAPTIQLEDDGFFTMASFFGGVAHPPGYPLFTLLQYGFTHLPFGSVAWRAHLGSGFYGAITCVILALCLRQLTGSLLWGLLAGAALAVSTEFWSQACINDVYTLNTAITAGLLYGGFCLAGYGDDPARSRILHGMALLFGLGLCNHWPLLTMLAPGLLCLVLPYWRLLLRKLPTLLLCMALGLLPYAWMIWRSQQPDTAFVFMGPLTSFLRFKAYTLREVYNGVDHSTSATVIDQWLFLFFFIRSWVKQFTLIGWLLATIGLVSSFRTCKTSIAIGLLAGFLSSILPLLLLLHFDYDEIWRAVFSVYPLNCYLITSIWLGLGARQLAKLLANPYRVQATIIASSFGVLALTWLHFPENNMHQFRDTERYAHAMLDPLPENSILITEGDTNTGVLGYFHYVEGMRPDILLLSRQGFLFNRPQLPPLLPDPERIARINTLVDANPGLVYFTNPYDDHPGLQWQDLGLLGNLHATTDIPTPPLKTQMQYLEQLVNEGDTPSEHYNWWQLNKQALIKRAC